MNIGRDGRVVLKEVKYVEDSTDLRVRPPPQRMTHAHV
jgi:hypothetical protein